ncbi:hypothetical protein [Comamonas terrigena]|uniref:hypothetical protein n=1 Tax=Comamonas terrigena TaxID=32013 RepID=UPI000A54BFA0|nr:hypothetical protein [Comamonas terrigena]BBL22680.1 hypothetical protein CT3_01350 [Comamonas terrigena NBRC 13299]SUY92366.1 Uncharacterised protein [Comamonas terrigena]
MHESDGTLASLQLKESRPRQSAPALAFSWSSLAKATAAAIGATATAFNFIGQEAYARYLAHWGFDDGLLPQETSDRVHHGYMAVFESIHTLLNGQFGAFLLLLIFIVCFIQGWLTSLMKKSPPRDTSAGKWLKRNADRLPGAFKSFFAAFGTSGLIVVLLYYVVLAAFVALAVAPIIGEHAAGKWAEKKEGEIKNGCQRNSKHSVCTELTRDGKVVGIGFIIASSTTRIAYFDITANHGRLIKFEDGELTGWMP